jgi:hypothetical protein
LDAQQRAAKAAEDSAVADERGATASERQVVAAWAQLIFAVIGTLVLLYTLYLTRASVKVAQDNLAIAREAMRLELRPYLSIRDFNMDRIFSIDGSKGFWVEPSIVNFGHTPARITKSIVSTRVVEDGNVEGIEWTDGFEGAEIDILAAPSVPLSLSRKGFPLEYAEELGAGKRRLFYRYYIEYRGPFEQLEPYKLASVVEVSIQGPPKQAFDKANVPVNSLIRIVSVSKGSIST